MSEQPEKDLLSLEFLREKSIRRSSNLLEAKRKRIKEELTQFISHIALLAPISKETSLDPENYRELLTEAVTRLGDDAFAELFISILQELK